MKALMTGLLALFLSFPAMAAGRTVAIELQRAGKPVAGFRVEIAADDESRTRGLMFRRKLAPDAGMLFVNEVPGRLAFWMKDTIIPLDMLFFTADGTLVHIHPRAKPEDLTLIDPGRGDICAVLEIGGGEAARRKIKPGDRLVVDKKALPDRGCLR